MRSLWCFVSYKADTLEESCAFLVSSLAQVSQASEQGELFGSVRIAAIARYKKFHLVWSVVRLLHFATTQGTPALRRETASLVPTHWIQTWLNSLISRSSSFKKLQSSFQLVRCLDQWYLPVIDFWLICAHLATALRLLVFLQSTESHPEVLQTQLRTNR